MLPICLVISLAVVPATLRRAAPQHLLDAAHKLRIEALELTKQVGLQPAALLVVKLRAGVELGVLQRCQAAIA